MTIFFAHPETLEIYRIPTALTPPSGKTGIELCETTIHGLEHVKIKMHDIYRSVNDNCSTAVLTGKL